MRAVDQPHVLAAVDPVDEPHLPQRAAAVEQLAHEALGEGEEVAAAASARERREVHVVRDGETLVVGPHRAPSAERHGYHSLAELRDELHARPDETAHVVEAEAAVGVEEGRALEDRHRIYLTLLAGEPRTMLVPVEEKDTETDVHRRVDPFEVEEGLVERTQSLVGVPGIHARKRRGQVPDSTVAEAAEAESAAVK